MKKRFSDGLIICILRKAKDILDKAALQMVITRHILPWSDIR